MPVSSDAKLVKYFEDAGLKVEFFPDQKTLGEASGIVGRAKRRFRKFRANSHLANYLKSQDLHNTIVQIDAGPWDSFALLRTLSGITHVFVTLHTPLPRPSSWRHAAVAKEVSSALLKSEFPPDGIEP